MKEGREMDAAIAERIFGWQWFNHPEKSIRYFRPEAVFRYGAIAEGDLIEYTDQLPHYSTDISAAWLVVERLISFGYPTITVSFSKGHQGYIATVWRNETDPEYEAGRYLASVMDERLSAPLAICLAALKALES